MICKFNTSKTHQNIGTKDWKSTKSSKRKRMLLSIISIIFLWLPIEHWLVRACCWNTAICGCCYRTFVLRPDTQEQVSSQIYRRTNKSVLFTNESRNFDRTFLCDKIIVSFCAPDLANSYSFFFVEYLLFLCLKFLKSLKNLRSLKKRCFFCKRMLSKKNTFVFWSIFNNISCLTLMSTYFSNINSYYFVKVTFARIFNGITNDLNGNGNV